MMKFHKNGSCNRLQEYRVMILILPQANESSETYHSFEYVL